jgi:hypothetical protein
VAGSSVTRSSRVNSPAQVEERSLRENPRILHRREGWGGSKEER